LVARDGCAAVDAAPAPPAVKARLIDRATAFDLVLMTLLSRALQM
jgi:hypothetical protein